jgi:carboxypeptidase Taq
MRMAAWDELLPKLNELADLQSTVALLHWDMAVNMPPGGAASRARAAATLETKVHEAFTSPDIGRLIEVLSSDDTLDQVQTASVRVLGHDYFRATRIPADLVHELARVGSAAYQAWTEARPASDFGLFEPHLTKLVQLKKEQADALGWEGHRYDALLDDYEPGTTTADLRTLFEGLAEELRPVAAAVLDAAGNRPAFLSGSYDPEAQRRCSHWLTEALGFDFERGRLDTSPHPFTMAVGPGDVRQTTGIYENDFAFSIWATIHETGHALYDQGIPEAFAALPQWKVPSAGMHESQSRLWENLVGRSRPFTDWLLPHLKEHFPSQLGTLDPDEFYRGINHPERTAIRVSADEVTYNLHVILRFELEQALIGGELDVAALPDAWDDGMQRHLGIRPADAAEGVLQDMHWSSGMFGYFPSYTIGNLYAAAFFQKAKNSLDGLDEEIRNGDFARLLQWLRAEVHSQGYLFTAKELGERVLGEPLTHAPFIQYIRTKYSEIYDINS